MLMGQTLSSLVLLLVLCFAIFSGPASLFERVTALIAFKLAYLAATFEF